MINLLDPTWILAISVILGGVVWLVRLEGKLSQTTKDVTRIDAMALSLEKKSEVVFDKIFDKLSIIEITLAKLDGKLSNDPIKK